MSNKHKVDLNNQTILVTGVAGFIGSNLSMRMLKECKGSTVIGLDKSDVIVGIEPTGHYWFDLGAYLEDEGILLVMVNP